MMELTASRISADSSMMAGVLPAPTPKAGLPLEYADLTMPGPPVARMISASFMMVLVISSDGISIQPMMPSGAPAATAASRTSFAAAMVLFFARGWGEMMMALLVFKSQQALKDCGRGGVGGGITAAITPMGSAMILMPKALSSSITPQVLVFL
jgi:hypothetical protein